MVWQEAESSKGIFEYDKDEKEKKVDKEIIKDERIELAKGILEGEEPEKPIEHKPNVIVFDSKKGRIKK